MNDVHNLLDLLRSSCGDEWERAITHSSSGRMNNERLELLGDAVLNLSLADLICDKFAEREGRLSRMSNYLRSDEVLNEIGRQIGLDAVVRTGSSHAGKVTDSMVAGCLEATMGAAYKNQGFDRTKALIEVLYLDHKRIDHADEARDPLTELKELIEELNIKVEHESLEQTVNGDNIFYHTILVDDNAAVAWARSKEKAEAKASAIMVSMLSNTDSSMGA